MGIITFLTEQDTSAVEQMRQIWKECFETGNEYLDFYFSKQYHPDRTLVYKDEGKVLGMITLMPCMYRSETENKEYKAVYLWALATLPQAQGQKIATKLMEKVDEVLKEQGVEVVLLCPGTPSLYAFYERKGYNEWFYLNLFNFPPLMEKTAKADLCLKELSCEEYYEKHIQKIPQDSIVWEKEHIEFAQQEAQYYHGGMYELMEGDKSLAVLNLYRYEEDEVAVKEFLVSDNVTEEYAVQSMRELFPQAKMEIRLPAKEGADNAKGGMAHFYLAKEQQPSSTNRAYLPFILD